MSFSSRSDAAQVFRKLGLRTRGAWRAALVAPRYEGLTAAARFRDALEELGGLHGAFAQFLCWRADLLGADYLGCLRRSRSAAPGIPRAEFARTVSTELGEKGERLARDLEPEPCWSTLSRCAYRTKHEGRVVVVQLARDPLPDAAFTAFERSLHLLDEEGARHATVPEVLCQFRQWVRLADSPGRERSYLEALSAMREKILVEYPAVVPEISAEKILCWYWVEGEPVSSRIAHGSPEAAQKMAEAVLEQLCILSVVDGELDPDAMVVTDSGRLALRRANRLMAVPAALVRIALKYVSAVLAGNSPLAAHSLLKLGCGRSPVELESRLLGALSSLQPELKVNLRFPPSATVFEGNWRALFRIGIEKPLFLDCLHRNLVAVGYWNAETTAPAGPAVDCLAEAQWPVLSRLLRSRLGGLFDRDAASEWFVGSGLLFFEALRQMNRLADEFQDNDLSIGVETADESEDASRRANRTVRYGVFTGMLLVIFLVCLRWGVQAPAPISIALAAIGGVAAVGLFWVVSRIG